MIAQKNNSISTFAKFGDKRLNLRFEKIVNILSQQFECSIPQSFKYWGQTKAMYRFLSNKKVNEQTILSGYLSSWTDEQITEHSVILAIHDTTEIDLTGKRSEDQLGCLMYENQKGFFLHNTLLCSCEGIPQVLFYQHYWGRNPDTLSKRKERKHLPIQEKESGRWVDGVERVGEFFKRFNQVTVINICDREGDIYELLDKAHQQNSHYIVRSSNNRRLKDETDKLWDQIKKEPSRGSYSIEVKDQKTLEKRIATIEVKWLNNIVLLPPFRKGQDTLAPLTINMVYVEEVNTPDGIEPIIWRLLTSLEIENLENALKVVTYYTYRWRIETFHYILKQGCKVEQLQLEQEQNLKNAISLYSAIACRLLSIMYLSREKPLADINSIGFNGKQYTLLCNYLEKNYYLKINQQTKENHTVENFILIVSMLGGYLKHNKPYPGIKVLWRGMKELTTILNCFALLPEIRCG